MRSLPSSLPPPLSSLISASRSSSSSSLADILLLLASSPTRFCIIAMTLDEAISNALDKAAKLLRIPYTRHAHGTALEHFFTAAPSLDMGGKQVPDVTMPCPMPSRLAFSYAGLHSTVERMVDARRHNAALGEHASSVCFQMLINHASMLVPQQPNVRGDASAGFGFSARGNKSAGSGDIM